MLHGVLDPQPGRLAFALFDGENMLRLSYEIMHPRDASQVPGFVEKELAACGKKLTDVRNWTFGCGPGSFTFLRVVAALGAGWAAGNPQIRFRCVPGALALAAKLELADGESGMILYDGRNKELLAFGVKNCGGQLQVTGEELILNAENARKFFREKPVKCAAFATDEAVLSALLDNVVPLKIVEPDISALIRAAGEFDNDADKMCYIRPAVS